MGAKIFQRVFQRFVNCSLRWRSHSKKCKQDRYWRMRRKTSPYQVRARQRVTPGNCYCITREISNQSVRYGLSFTALIFVLVCVDFVLLLAYLLIDWDCLWFGIRLFSLNDDLCFLLDLCVISAKMSTYTTSEYANMHLIYGECRWQTLPWKVPKRCSPPRSSSVYEHTPFTFLRRPLPKS